MNEIDQSQEQIKILQERFAKVCDDMASKYFETSNRICEKGKCPNSYTFLGEGAAACASAIRNEQLLIS
jgi:hypothetical protein